jgi:hypothetical protein
MWQHISVGWCVYTSVDCQTIIIIYSLNMHGTTIKIVNLNVFLVRGTLQTCPFLQQQVKENEVYVTGIG